MKTHKNNKNIHTVQYNDNDMSHVTSGPEYGQPWRGANQVWEENEADNYVDWVNEIQEAILNRLKIRI